MTDVSAIQIGAGAAGVVSASALIMILIQRIKDYCPSIGGRKAMGVCDAVSLIVAILVVYQTEPDWNEGITYISLAMLTLSFGVVARALFSLEHHVSVRGAPASADASVAAEDVDDPHADTPATGRRK